VRNGRFDLIDIVAQVLGIALLFAPTISLADDRCSRCRQKSIETSCFHACEHLRAGANVRCVLKCSDKACSKECDSKASEDCSQCIESTKSSCLGTCGQKLGGAQLTCLRDCMADACEHQCARG